MLAQLLIQFQSPIIDIAAHATKFTSSNDSIDPTYTTSGDHVQEGNDSTREAADCKNYNSLLCQNNALQLKIQFSQFIQTIERCSHSSRSRSHSGLSRCRNVSSSFGMTCIAWRDFCWAFSSSVRCCLFTLSCGYAWLGPACGSRAAR